MDKIFFTLPTFCDKMAQKQLLAQKMIKLNCLQKRSNSPKSNNMEILLNN